jgi:DNA repair protein RecN (Recombination protein N)
MLRFLRIRRLAVIEAAEVEFGPGLNVLTGETGAGKSILVEAVGLLLGGRASGDLVRTGEESATIEAIFEHDGEEWLIRREITAQGRSRALVNGELSTAGALRELSSRLIELHGQHEHQTLLDPSVHITVLDSFGAITRQRQDVADAFTEMQTLRLEVDRVRRALADRASRLELIAFQLDELELAGLVKGEDEELSSTRQVLVSAERVERLCREGYQALYEKDDAVLSALSGVWKRVGELDALDAQFQPYLDAREGIKSQLEDLAVFLRRYVENIDASPARLEQVEQRLALLERLKRKYGQTLDRVLETRDRLRQERAGLVDGDERIAGLEARLAEARTAYITRAADLTKARRTVAAAFAKGLERELADLAMERTRFEVRFGDALAEPAWTAEGVDQIEFFVSPNQGEDLRPLARIVSGGELSRVMLAIKTLMATTRHGFTRGSERPPSAAAPGLIFDEVDAGIGGRVADVVGAKLRTLGSAFQVLCITHLPQIAANADAHYQIEKRVAEGRTQTTVRRLDRAAQVEEIARMLGGAGVTEGIRASAVEMIERRRALAPVEPSTATPSGAAAAGAKGERRPKGESESPKGRRVTR